LASSIDITYARRLTGRSVAVDDELTLIEGEVLLAGGDVDGALAVWGRARGAEPSAVAVRRRRASVLAERGRCDEAEADLGADPDDVLLRARCRLRSGQAALALQLLREAGFEGEDLLADAAWLEGVATYAGAEGEATGVWERLKAADAAGDGLDDAVKRR
jgi:hypothetical protein